MSSLPMFDPPLPPEVERLVREARQSESSSRRDEARELYEGALRALPGPAYAPAASTLLRWIGRTHAQTNDHGAALDCFEAALAVARTCGDEEAEASALNSLASSLFERGQLEECEAHFQAARRLAVGSGNRKMLAMAEQNLASVAHVRGDLSLALLQYEISLEGYTALGLDEYVGPLLSNIGGIRIDLGDWSGARRALDDAASWCQRVGDKTHRILVEVMRARLHLAAGEPHDALLVCQEAEEIALAAGDERWNPEIWRNYGAGYARIGRPHLAVDYLRRARESAEAQHTLFLAADTAREQAAVFRALGRNQDTLRCLNDAHHLFITLQARRELADVGERLVRLQADFLEIVQEWGESIESKDAYTLGHCGRVADWACALADSAGLPEEVMVWFRMGALLHDLGKVDVPLTILNKPGPLTPAERRVIERHPVRGIELLGDVEFPWDVKPMIRHHHERWDGSGYPDGLRADDIPWTARILTVADIYDALTTDRAYRPGFASSKALDIMTEEVGRSVDPDLFPLFVDLVESGPPASALPFASRGRQPLTA